MRKLSVKEAGKRGCKYCTDARPHNNNCSGNSKYACVHEECPYHVLDESDDYVAWLKAVEPIKIPGARKRLMRL